MKADHCVEPVHSTLKIHDVYTCTFYSQTHKLDCKKVLSEHLISTNPSSFSVGL